MATRDLAAAPLVVAAVGGNALLRRGEQPDASVQAANVRQAAASLAALAADRRLAVTHGNGPQVGLLALDSAASAHPQPLDVLDAQTQGQIGYLLAVELANALGDRPVVTVLTQVEVRADDPAFAQPTKPIGPSYGRAQAEALAAAHGWTVAPDGPRWRRVVASPEPLAVVELSTVRLLLDAGVVVVCAGGGGVPVVRDDTGQRRGVEAVVDKDLTTALLAVALGAEQLLLLTDVDAVYDDFGGPHSTPVRRATVDELRDLCLGTGSMAPKVLAAGRACAHGITARIGALADAVAVSRGGAGTEVSGDPGIQKEIPGTDDLSSTSKATRVHP